MTLAYVVYFGLLIALMTCWTIAARTAAAYPARSQAIGTQAAWFTIALFTLIIGCRYAVGGDFFGYIYYYQSTSLSDRPSDVVFEPGFLWLIQFLKIFDAPDRSIIAASSFLQIAFFSIWLRNKKEIAPFFIYFFITITLLDVDNLIRQGIALFALLMVVENITKRRAAQAILWLVIATLFHRSAVIMLPIGLALWNVRIPKPYIQIAALIFSYVFVSGFTSQVISIFERLSPLFGYDGYADITRADLAFEGIDSSLNLGKYLWPIVDILVMSYSLRLSSFYDRHGYRAYHAMFLIAAILQPVAVAWDFMPFARALFYFTAMRMICLGFLLRYCLFEGRSGRNIVIGFGTCAVFAVWLIIAVSRGAAFSAPYEF